MYVRLLYVMQFFHLCSFVLSIKNVVIVIRLSTYISYIHSFRQEFEAIEDFNPKDKKSVKLIAGEIVEVVEKSESGL